MDTSAAVRTMGKDEFLKLFTSQLKYQDPLKPLESTEFTAQLAQFSTLEQLFNMNRNVQQMVTYQNAMINGIMAGFIGKEAKTEDGITGKVTGISFDGATTNIVLDNGLKLTLGQIKEIYENI